MMLLMLAGAVAELVTVGAVIPLLALAADPNYFAGFPAANRIISSFGLEEPNDLIVAAAGFLVIAAIASTIVRSALIWSNSQVVFGIGFDISLRVFTRMLHQPYESYVQQNSSAPLSALEKIYIVTAGIIGPLVAASTSAIIAISIIVFLFIVDPIAAAVALTSIGTVYVAISLISKRALLRNSRRTALIRTQRLKAVQESWGGMRDIILDQSQPIFERRLAEYEDEMRHLMTKANFVVEAPRYTVEGFGIIVVAMLAVYFSWQPGGVLAYLPILGALALGAQRLLPLVQAMYRGWASYSINAHAFQDVLDLMELPVKSAAAAPTSGKTLPDQATIEVQDLHFGYREGEEILKGVSLRIRPGERVGFIGKTGSGKSTLVDVMMGLLKPSSGRILLSGTPLDDSNTSEWQTRIAHVPQAIFLSDDSVAANIAFGCSADEIDMARVVHAAERADIRNFIDQLPDGFETTVGERGIRLSGGQRQRIGIARALYKDASLLIFDEATSALDSDTEASVMEAVQGLDRNLTIILIAHRLSTLAACDTVYRMETGRIAQTGSYRDVVVGSHGV
jgi:ABC-type multidrug transport system fused ATPase/permease subunit